MPFIMWMSVYNINLCIKCHINTLCRQWPLLKMQARCKRQVDHLYRADGASNANQTTEWALNFEIGENKFIRSGEWGWCEWICKWIYSKYPQRPLHKTHIKAHRCTYCCNGHDDCHHRPHKLRCSREAHTQRIHSVNTPHTQTCSE